VRSPLRALQGAAILIGLIAFVGVASAHDFWLVPNAFRIAPGGEISVSGQTSSSFPSSLSAVTVDRVAEARLFGPEGEHELDDLSVEGRSLLIRHVPNGAGQRIIAVRIHPRGIPESPESFRRYLALEGAPEALERYEREGLLPTDSIIRRYAKYAKTIVEVGDDGPRVFSRAVGHPLEFMPLDDPANAHAGRDLRFRLLFEGEPLAGAKLHAGAARDVRDEAPFTDVTLETDAAGEFTLRVQEMGIWNVRALHIVPADPGSGADWDVHWATLVFGVKGT
jgi:Domain of unknown function (DUF4198)